MAITDERSSSFLVLFKTFLNVSCEDPEYAKIVVSFDEHEDIQASAGEVEEILQEISLFILKFGHSDHIVQRDKVAVLDHFIEKLLLRENIISNALLLKYVLLPLVQVFNTIDSDENVSCFLTFSAKILKHCDAISCSNLVARTSALVSFSDSILNIDSNRSNASLPLLRILALLVRLNSTGHIVTKRVLWDICMKALHAPNDAPLRKTARFLLQCCVDRMEKNKKDDNAVFLGELFRRPDIIREALELLEVAEEKQVHVVVPVISRIFRPQFWINDDAFTMRLWACVLRRYFNHPSSQVCKVLLVNVMQHETFLKNLIVADLQEVIYESVLHCLDASLVLCIFRDGRVEPFGRSLADFVSKLHELFPDEITYETFLRNMILFFMRDMKEHALNGVAFYGITWVISHVLLKPVLRVEDIQIITECVVEWQRCKEPVIRSELMVLWNRIIFGCTIKNEEAITSLFGFLSKCSIGEMEYSKRVYIEYFTPDWLPVVQDTIIRWIQNRYDVLSCSRAIIVLLMCGVDLDFLDKYLWSFITIDNFEHRRLDVMYRVQLLIRIRDYDIEPAKFLNVETSEMNSSLIECLKKYAYLISDEPEQWFESLLCFELLTLGDVNKSRCVDVDISALEFSPKWIVYWKTLWKYEKLNDAVFEKILSFLDNTDIQQMTYFHPDGRSLSVVSDVWACVRLVVSHSKSTVSPNLLENCLNILHTVPRSDLFEIVKTIVLLFRVVPDIPTVESDNYEDISLPRDAFLIVWKSCLEVRRCGDIFRPTVKCLAEGVFGCLYFLTRRKDAVFDLLGEMDEYMETIPWIAWTVYSTLLGAFELHPQLLEDERYLRCVRDALLYGSLNRRDARVYFEVETYIVRNREGCVYLPETEMDYDMRVRAKALCFLLMDKMNAETVINMVRLLLSTDMELTHERKRYYQNSSTHRRKQRVWQAILAIFRRFAAVHRTISDNVFENLVGMLRPYCFRTLEVDLHQPSIRFMIEWLCALFILFDRNNQRNDVDVHVQQCKQAGKQRVGCVSSFLNSLMLFVAANKFQPISLVHQVLEAVLPWTFSQHFNTRIAAQRIFSAILNRYADHLPEELSSFSVVQAAMQEAVQLGAVARNFDTSSNQSMFPFESFDAVKHLNIFMIVWILPQQNGLTHLETLTGSMIRDAATSSGSYKDDFGFFSEELAIEAARVHNEFVSHSRDKMELGLCRTCEIFGASELVLNSLKIVEQQAFRNLSVSSHLRVNLSAVAAANLSDYLNRQRRNGYTLVGIEQTARSVMLDSFEFPQKTLLLLGAEQSGIPTDLIDQLDVCLEVPQWGVTRSLNVHVCGAICIWEYTKRHKPVVRESLEHTVIF